MTEFPAHLGCMSIVFVKEVCFFNESQGRGTIDSVLQPAPDIESILARTEKIGIFTNKI